MTISGFLAFLDYHALGLICTVLVSVGIGWIIAEEMDL